MRLLQGNEACAEGALYAGCRFFAGYPITPSSEIAEHLARRMPQVGGTFAQMEDEIASLAACIGASLTGVKAMTATSGPGFSLKQEHIGFAAMAEVPCVVVDAQRAGPSTGMPTSPAQGDVQQARWGTHGDHPVVVYSPWSVQETFELTVRAFNVAETLRVPVILLLDEVVAHMREGVELPAPGRLPVLERPRPTGDPAAYRSYACAPGEDVPPMADFGTGYRMAVTGLTHDESGFPSGRPGVADALVRRLAGKVERRAGELTAVDGRYLEDAQIVLISFGCTARAGLRAVRLARERGLPVGLLRLIGLWPFPDRVVAELAGRVRGMLVAEMNLGQVRREVERAARGACPVAGHHRVDGELMNPEELLAALEALA